MTISPKTTRNKNKNNRDKSKNHSIGQLIFYYYNKIQEAGLLYKNFILLTVLETKSP